MSYEAINNWVEKAKSEELIVPKPDGVLVIKRIDPKNKGWAIVKIAETLFPWFTKMFEGDRDKNGMLIHPARIRAIALNVAQSMVKDQEDKK